VLFYKGELFANHCLNFGEKLFLLLLHMQYLNFQGSIQETYKHFLLEITYYVYGVHFMTITGYCSDECRPVETTTKMERFSSGYQTNDGHLSTRGMIGTNYELHFCMHRSLCFLFFMSVLAYVLFMQHALTQALPWSVDIVQCFTVRTAPIPGTSFTWEVSASRCNNYCPPPTFAEDRDTLVEQSFTQIKHTE